MEIERIIESAGGIARTSELRRGGYPDELIRVFGGYGVIVNVSHGWWALPGLSAGVARARAIGGRLACVSALAFHEGTLDSDDRQPLHVSLPRSGKRPVDPEVVVHWSRRVLAGDRQAVSVEVAREQARRCIAGAGTL